MKLCLVVGSLVNSVDSESLETLFCWVVESVYRLSC